MEILVLIEPLAGNGYQAGALGLIAHGATEQEALAKLQQALALRQAPRLFRWNRDKSRHLAT